MSSNSTKQFRVLPEHVKLLQSAYVGWDSGEFGAPAIDCKRPYGNSSVIPDIGEILGETPEDDATDDYGGWSRAQEERFCQLHEETAHALQIFLRTGVLQPGLYEAEKYRQDWRRIGD